MVSEWVNIYRLSLAIGATGVLQAGSLGFFAFCPAL